MAKREVVRVDVSKVVKCVKARGWSASTFCRMMDRSVSWISGWKVMPPRNLPSPEEAARMCGILGVEPGEILTEQTDIDRVTSLLGKERLKKIQLATDDELNQEFKLRYDELSEENQRKVDEYIALLLSVQSK